MRPHPTARLAALSSMLVLLALPACRAPRAERVTPPPGAERLTGVWDASFVVERPPMAVDAAGLRRSGGDRVSGAVSFLPLAEPERSPGADPSGLGTAIPVAYAVWDLDFTPAGFDVRPEGQVPAAVAAIDTGPAAGSAADSIRIILGPTSPTGLTLAGAWRGESLVGRWQLRSPSRSTLAASGTFALVPRARPAPGRRPSPDR